MARCVHVAGGGVPPATSRPRSPSPTRCAAATRRRRSPRWAPSAASRPGSCPARGYHARADPAGADAAAARARTCSGCRAGCAPRWRGRRRPARAPAPTCSSASAATSPRRPTSPPAGCTSRSSCTRPTPRPGLANRLGARLHAVRRHQLPGHAARARPLTRAAAPPQHRHARPGRQPRRGAGRLRPRPGPADAAGDRRLAGRPAAQRGGVGRGRRPARPPASRCCTRPARRTPWRVPAAPPGGPPYVVVPYLDRMDLAYAAADLALCRAGANTVVELTAVGLPAVYVPAADRQRRAAAQRRAGRRRRRRAARRRRGTARPTGWPRR